MIKYKTLKRKTTIFKKRQSFSFFLEKSIFIKRQKGITRGFKNFILKPCNASFDKSVNLETVDSNNFFLEKKVSNIFFNNCFDKNHLKTVLAWFLEYYGEKKTIDLVETLKQVGFHQATRAGVSLGVDDLEIPPQKAFLLSQASVKMTDVRHDLETGNLTSVEKSQRLIDTWNQTSETLRQAAVYNFRITNPVNPVYMMAFSGARGNISQVRQLVAMRGLMADPQGAILEFPIQSNFREGLTITEYLISCYGARKGLVDTALRTATSGYLTRRLVDAVQHVVINVINCQTKNGIFIKNKNLEQRLIGRVLQEDVILELDQLVKKDTLISPRLAKQLAAKHNKIFVRSPLTCQTEKSVCQLCYGIDLAQGKLVSLGEAVGIIAAQSIGEPGTQLTMRTFHTGGVGVFSDQAMKSFTAPFDGQITFLSSLPGLFVRTPHGNIVYLLKHKSIQKDKPFLKLISTESTSSNFNKIVNKSLVYEIKNEDVPAGSLLWVKQGEFVKTGQLLVQASRLQTSRQEMPESSHPVRSPLSGEIFFQFIKIRIIEKQKRSVLKIKKKKQENKTVLQNNQKEISPTFPTLLELGNFWVFSSFIQKQGRISNLMLVKGDLLSTNTPIQQYNFQIPYKGQLKTLKSSIVFAEPVKEFLFSKINYFGVFYFFSTIENTFQKNPFLLNSIFSYTSNSMTSRLTWYPYLKNFEFCSSSYYLKFSLNSTFTKNIADLSSKLRFEEKKSNVSLKNLEFTEKANHYFDTRDNSHYTYLWSPHQIFSLKKSNSFSQIRLFSCSFKKQVNPYSFLLASESDTLTRKGVFQIKLYQGIAWSTKNTFKKNFLKNFSTGALNTNTAFLNKKIKTAFVAKNQLSARLFLMYKLKHIKKTPTFTFIKNGLKVTAESLFIKGYTKLVQKEHGWFAISENFLPENTMSKLTGIVLEPGKKFENISFPHSYTSVSFLSKKNVLILKSRRKSDLGISKNNVFRNYYLLGELIFSKKPFKSANNVNNVKFLLKARPNKKTRFFGECVAPKFMVFEKNYLHEFCFYKKHESTKEHNEMAKNGLFFLSKSNFDFERKNKQFLEIKNKKFTSFSFETKRKRSVSQIIFFQKYCYRVAPDRKFFYETWLSQKKDFSLTSLNSPLFTKQFKTIFLKTETKKLSFQLNPSPSFGYSSMANFFKINLEFENPKTIQKLEEFKQKIYLPGSKKSHFCVDFPNENQASLTKNQSVFLLEKHQQKLKNNSNFPTQSSISCLKSEKANSIPIQGLNIIAYRKIILENPNRFCFETFQGGWVLPDVAITRAFLKSKKLGEFRRFQNKQKDVYLSILRTQDAFTLLWPKHWINQNLVTAPKIGTRLRWGQELVPGFANPLSGQITKLTPTAITLRKAFPLVASVRGLLHITHNDLVQKNDLLITLRSRRLQTEDIVQGIPKIEQLFEARETQGGEIIKNNMHMLLSSFFNLARQVRPLAEAVDLSLSYIQKFLVENILQAYSNQGVQIAEKHVEVVVRQMTARVRITHGGNSGFLPGELVQLRVIEKLNNHLAAQNLRQASYEPVILGITKSVLQSESFLLAASFQQVSKVLVRSALGKKTDFLRGLHENILVGQPIPAGTGIINHKQSKQNFSEPLTGEK